MIHDPRLLIVLILGLVALGKAEAATSQHLTAPHVSARFFRDGGAYGLGQMTFSAEPEAKEKASEEPSLRDESKGAASVEVKADEPPSVLDLSWNLVSMETYETKPAKHADSTADWHCDSEFSADLTWKLSDDFSVTPSLGTRWIRFSTLHELSSDEPFAGLQLAWQLSDAWKLILRHESFWDLELGFGKKVFAAHTTTARLQCDLPNPQNDAMRWQFYLEAARSLAEPSVHDYCGGAAGFGTAIRIVPQRLRFQIGAGVSYQRYPRFLVEEGTTRQGWNAHGACALVWTPCDNAEISIGLEFMHSAETGRQFHFNDLSVPLAVRLNF